MEQFFRLTASCKEQLASKLGQEPDDWKFLVAAVTTLLAAILAVFAAVDCIYKLYLHPLAKFPGPTAACLSRRWLHRVSMDGHPEELFEALHQKYSESS